MQNNPEPDRIHQFEALCHQRGIPVTVQRRLILEELLASSDHPTAERIFRAVQRRAPGLSQTTVYRVLELLVEMGLARKTCHPESVCRYDPHVHRHHHLICQTCDRMVDLDDSALNGIPLPSPERTGFELVDYSIQFRGTCPDCLRKRDEPEGGRSL
jgi:Fur family transcriptional regulator, peroxide stress response regulator